MNLPGMFNWDPSLPRVMKLRADGKLAAEAPTFADDGQIIGSSYALTRKATRKIASGIQALGFQDAAPKQEVPAQATGPWQGAVMWADGTHDILTMTQEKWDKAVSWIQIVWVCVDTSHRCPHAELNSYTGYMIHVTQTFPEVGLYLTTTYLTLNSWRPNRSPEGWQIENTLPWQAGIDIPDQNQESPPELVGPVPGVKRDTKVLMTLFQPGLPAQINLRPSKVLEILYGSGDASKAGFGQGSTSSLSGTSWRRGIWCTEQSEKASNNREMRTGVNFLKSEIQRGLKNGVVIIVMDNSTFIYPITDSRLSPLLPTS